MTDTHEEWKEMAAMYGLGEEIIKYRINKRGMTVEQAVSTPLREKRANANNERQKGFQFTNPAQ